MFSPVARCRLRWVPAWFPQPKAGPQQQVQQEELEHQEGLPQEERRQEHQEQLPQEKRGRQELQEQQEQLPQEEPGHQERQQRLDTLRQRLTAQTVASNAVRDGTAYGDAEVERHLAADLEAMAAAVKRPRR